MPSRGHHYELFDALRGIAALAVVTYHVAAITAFTESGLAGGIVIAGGPLAVTVFFAISGFLLYRPFVSARARGRGLPAVGEFLRRRVLRLVPAYWVALTLLAIWPGITGVFTADWWRFYLFAQIYDARTFGQGIPSAWTLGVEAAFYVTLPLWAVVVRRLPVGGGWLRAELVALAAIFVAGMTVLTLAGRQTIPKPWADSLAGQVPYIAIGMAFAVASVARREAGLAPPVRRWWPETCWGLALVGVLAIVATYGGRGLAGEFAVAGAPRAVGDTLLRALLNAAVTTLVLAPAVFGEARGGPVRAVLRWAPLRGLGVISFSFYLWHLTIAQLLGTERDPIHFPVSGLGLALRVDEGATPILLVLTLVITAAIGTASYWAIERPFMRAGRRA